MHDFDSLLRMRAFLGKCVPTRRQILSSALLCLLMALAPRALAAEVTYTENFRRCLTGFSCEMKEGDPSISH